MEIVDTVGSQFRCKPKQTNDGYRAHPIRPQVGSNSLSASQLFFMLQEPVMVEVAVKVETGSTDSGRVCLGS